MPTRIIIVAESRKCHSSVVSCAKDAVARQSHVVSFRMRSTSALHSASAVLCFPCSLLPRSRWHPANAAVELSGAGQATPRNAHAPWTPCAAKLPSHPPSAE
jgi:hypothetical protein